MQLRRRLAQAQLDVAQLVAGALRARARAARAARPHARRAPTRPAAPSPSSGASASAAAAAASASSATCRSRSRSARSALLVARLEALGVLDERAQLGEARLARARRSRSAPRGGAAPRASSRQAARASARRRELLLAAEPVEHLELVRRPREAPLLELPRHRDHALDRGGDVLARGRAAPGVRARAPVAEDAPRDEQRVLVLGPQLGELVELVRQVELGLDVRLRAGGPTNASSPFVPSRRPTACARIVLPAPVSPVIAFSPGASSSSASRMSTRFSMRSRRSIGVIVERASDADQRPFRTTKVSR